MAIKLPNMSETEYLKANGAEVISHGDFNIESLTTMFNYDPTFPTGKGIGQIMNWWISCYIADSDRRWFIENGKLLLVIPSSEKELFN